MEFLKLVVVVVVSMAIGGHVAEKQFPRPTEGQDDHMQQRLNWFWGVTVWCVVVGAGVFVPDWASA